MYQHSQYESIFATEGKPLDSSQQLFEGEEFHPKFKVTCFPAAHLPEEKELPNCDPKSLMLAAFSS